MGWEKYSKLIWNSKSLIPPEDYLKCYENLWPLLHIKMRKKEKGQKVILGGIGKVELGLRGGIFRQKLVMSEYGDTSTR